MKKEIEIWFDKKADFLEVMFEIEPGYFRDTENDAVMEKVDIKGNVIGFSIMGVSSIDKSISVALGSHSAEKNPDDPSKETKREPTKAMDSLYRNRNPRTGSILTILKLLVEDIQLFQRSYPGIQRRSQRS